MIYAYTTSTNIGHGRVITIVLELYDCCKANIECRTPLILAVACLWLTYSTFIQCLLHNRTQSQARSILHTGQILSGKVQYTAMPILRMRLYNVG